MVDSDGDLDTDGAAMHGGRPLEVVPDRPTPARPQAPLLADRLLDGSDDAIVAYDDRGVVRTANAAARVLLPGARPGQLLLGPLARSADEAGTVDFADGARRFSARRRALPHGWTAWFVSDVTEQQARLDNLLAERARSRFLATAGRRLGLSLHPGRTARVVVELAAAELADAAVVVWPTPGGDGVAEWVARDRDGRERSGRAVAAGLPAPVLDALRGLETDPRPLLLDDLAEVPWIDVAGLAGHGEDAGLAGGPPSSAAVPSAGIVSLPGNGVPAGALVLVRRASAAPEPAVASAGEAAFVDEFAARAGIALAAAALYTQQVRTTGVLRHSLAQPPLPHVPGVAFGAAYRPSDEGLLIGGDFYDVLPGPDGATTFLLGDVCGKGVEAAVGTGQLRQSVLALRRLVHDPVRLLELLNATMLETMPPDCAPRFVTLVLGVATPRPGGGVQVQLAGGGHLPPLVVRRGGTVEAVTIGGMLVGAVPEARFGRRAVDLAPGESCVLYSDGVTEARGGVDGRQAFGEERLAEILRGCDVLPAAGIADRVALHAMRWLAAGHHDDIAALVVQAPLHVVRSAERHLRSVHRVPSSDPPARTREESP